MARKWGTRDKKALDAYTKYAEAEISKLKSENQEQKEAMQLEINTATEDLGMVSRRLFNTRGDNGKLRKELNKVKQKYMFDMRKLRKSYERLKKERNGAED